MYTTAMPENKKPAPQTIDNSMSLPICSEFMAVYGGCIGHRSDVSQFCLIKSREDLQCKIANGNTASSSDLKQAAANFVLQCDWTIH